MTKMIKTNIKFNKGLGDDKDKIYGFVTKSKGGWKGCRETEKKKKIVFVDFSIEKSIIPNVLYSCLLIPMCDGNGFIALSASIIKFKGVVAASYRNSHFSVKVSFGNRVIVYDPSSKESCKRNIKTIADKLRNHVDLKNAYEVTEEFINTACLAKRLNDQYHQDV